MQGINSVKHNEIFYQFPEHIVVGVSPVIAWTPGRRVGKYDWRPRVPQSVQHRLLGDVRDVDHHSQPVHLQNDSLVEVGGNLPHSLHFQMYLLIRYLSKVTESTSKRFKNLVVMLDLGISFITVGGFSPANNQDQKIRSVLFLTSTFCC